MVFIIAFASMLFSWFVRSLLLLDFFYVNKHIFPVQPMIFDPPLNPETISPVWFDYESPVLYMVKPVFITTRYGLSSTGKV